MEKELYFEDFAPGQQFTNGGYTISKEAAIAFATQYDPQPFHIDEEAAKQSIFGKLAVCGMQTAAVTMRLKMGSGIQNVAGGLVGLGMEQMRWPVPVFPGDTLRIVVSVTGARVSNSNPKNGVVRYKIETFNQNDALVMEIDTAVLVPRKENKGL